MVERETNEEIMMNGCSATSGSNPTGTLRYWIAVAVAAGVAALALWSGNVDSASAKSEIFSYTSEPTTTQAGGHPDIATTFVLGNRLNQEPSPCYCNDPKDVTLHVPTGVIANPHVVAECPIAELVLATCSADSQAGVVVVQLFGYVIIPLYRMIPQEGQAGLFSFVVPIGPRTPQYVVFNSRTDSDYGLDVKTQGISHLLPFDLYAPIFWGVPGAAENDLMRSAPGEIGASCETNPVDDVIHKNIQALRENCFQFKNKVPVASSLPIAPLTQNPTTCVGPLTSSIDTVAYDRGTDEAEAAWPATTGCDQLSFDPSLAANPTTTEADTASGLEVDLRVPQFQDPYTPTPSELRANTVTLPEGFSLNPNAADGKVFCSDAAARVGTVLSADCPEFSKVGTVMLDSSALPTPIPGYIYIGEPKPGDPYRIVLTANGFGTAVKLIGSVHADPQTGQLVTVFENLPQTPLQRFVLHYFGSERGILATPTQCGTYAVNSTFTPWAAEISAQNATQFFRIDSGPSGSPCPDGARPFAPSFQAGSVDNTAGTHSPFSLRLTRKDGEQNLSGVSVTTPPGFLASLRGIPYCPESALGQLASTSYSGRSEQAASACPAASHVGTVITGAGAGTHPVYLPGKVYLAGPYKGAPLSLVAVVPAVSGPYDLGNVAVRVALNVDPVTAQVSAISDPLPQILEGIPLRLRSIQLSLDRDGFVINPTNCDPFSVESTISGNEGAQRGTSARFQVANCAVLPFGPKVTLQVTGSTKRRGHPSLRGVVEANAGEANIRRAVVTLPPNELLDNSHIGAVCTRVQFAQDACPANSVYGTAEARTPLLDEPLRGSVYLRSSSRKLPDLVAALEGQIDIDLIGRIGTARSGALRTTFESIPDAPVTTFALTLKGGAKGLLVNSRDMCLRPQAAQVKLAGQNGKAVSRRVKLRAPCGSAARKRHRVLRAKAVR